MSRRHIVPFCFALASALAAHQLGSRASGPMSGDGPGAPTVEANPELVREYQATITDSELVTHVEVLASDGFGGRRSTFEGQRLAARYLATRYRELGLAPAKAYASFERDGAEAYFLPFKVIVTRVERMALSARLAETEIASSLFGDGYSDGNSYVAKGSLPSSTGDLVFAGYGIRDRTAGYDDYAALHEEGVEVRGSWLMILDGEPLDEKGRSILTRDAELRSKWSVDGESKTRALAGLGSPRGLLIVDHARAHREMTFSERIAEAEELAVADISLEYDVKIPRSMPVVVVTEAFADQLLEPSGETVEKLASKIARREEPVVFRVRGVTLESEMSLTSEKRVTENVAALIEGADTTLKNEFVLLSSHYDHEGTILLPGSDRIKNGADDDASGTAALLEIADAFAQARRNGAAPRRSILFVHFAAEEEGLLGSEYYADIDPARPLASTVAVLNADMIGRTDPSVGKTERGYIDVIGARLSSSQLEAAVMRVNELTAINLDISHRFDRLTDPNLYYRRSDHWNLAKHGIPYLFFFRGDHEDYHRVGDEAEKVEYGELARAARLILGIAWDVAAVDERPSFDRSGL